MILMTEELKTKIPRLYSQEKEPDPTVHVKYFDLCGSWSWYATEFDGVDIFFGWVDGDFPELGYFSLSELQSVKINGVQRIERDIYFAPRQLSEIKQSNRRQSHEAN